MAQESGTEEQKSLDDFADSSTADEIGDLIEGVKATVEVDVDKDDVAPEQKGTIEYHCLLCGREIYRLYKWGDAVRCPGCRHKPKKGPKRKVSRMVKKTSGDDVRSIDVE